MGGACSTYWSEKNYIQVLGGNRRRYALGRPKNRWYDNIITDLKYIGWEGVDWIDLAKDRDRWRNVVKTVTYLRVAQSAGNFLTS